MQLAGREPSVLVGGSDYSSGGENISDLLVGMLLPLQYDSGEIGNS